MRRIVVRMALVFGASGIVTMPADSQARPHERNGFLIGFGIGGGSAGVAFEGGGDINGEGGGSGNFRIGYAPQPDLAVHFETSVWFGNASDDAKMTLSLVAATVTVYPRNVGFFVRGGLGCASAWFHSEVDVGWGLLAAAGYEVRLSRTFALGPQVEFAQLALGGDLMDSANFVNGSLQFNWYW